MAGLREFLLLVLVSLALAGCASGPPSAEALAQNDPYEAANRKILAFDGTLDRYFVRPSAGAYDWGIPNFGRERIHDLLDNLSLPVTFANDLLQGEIGRAGETAKRFVVNATVGLGGLFDPATAYHMPNHSEDFGLTLGTWGVGEGPYLVLPLLGPDPPRDAIGQAAGLFIDPLHWVHYKQHIWWDAEHEYFTLLDLRGRNFQVFEGIERSSVDYYAALRSFYRQVRNNAIRKGRLDVKNLPQY
jgi:phospholipid-binding lipoprotein MlaA